MNNTIQAKNYQSIWFVMIAVFLGGFIIGGYSYWFWFSSGVKSPTLVEKREGGFQFINPLLECDGARQTIGDQEMKPFQKTIEEITRKIKNQKRVSHISVYFRDLNNGPWFGVDEDELFSPASLLKVPIMIVYYKAAEARPAMLKKTILYSGNSDLNRMENIKLSRELVAGKRYSVEELIERMIVNSDNNAADLLLKHIDQNVFAKVREDLGVLPYRMTDVQAIVSVKTYATTFRILFNSSYLNRDMSERALGYLARSEFPYALVAGVPAGIRVAHKYGERAYDDMVTKQLHDCGIVYYPESPYLLCVMSRGADFDVLAETIKEISAMVFREVDKSQKKHILQ